MTHSLVLNFYGVWAKLRSDHEEILASLREDFKYFIAARESEGGPKIAWDLYPVAAPPTLAPRGLAAFRLGDYKVYDSGKIRRIVYDDNALAVYDYGLRRGSLYAADAERLHELAYLAVLSRVGEELDGKGLHRVHALGFEFKGQAGLILLPSGGGKSTLALELLRQTDMGIIADDTPLISPDMRLHAFPLRWGFLPAADLSGIPESMIRIFQRKQYGPKKLVDVDFFRSRVRTGCPLRWLIIGSRHSGEPRLERASRLQVLSSLSIHLIAGHGIAQMSEYVLRPNSREIIKLLNTALRRFRTAFKLARSMELHHFRLGTNTQVNIDLLKDFLGSDSGNISLSCPGVIPVQQLYKHASFIGGEHASFEGNSE